MALLKNGNGKVKNYFDYKNDSNGTLKYKRGVISKYHLDTPLFSWPKDKISLLSIINTHLANLQLDKMNDSLDDIEEKRRAKKKAREEKASEEKSVEGEEKNSESEESQKSDEEKTSEENK